MVMTMAKTCCDSTTNAILIEEVAPTLVVVVVIETFLAFAPVHFFDYDYDHDNDWDCDSEMTLSKLHLQAKCSSSMVGRLTTEATEA